MVINDAMAEILQLYGLEEIPGKKNNQEIVKLFHFLGHDWVDNDEVAWCAALFGSKLLKHGYKIPEIKHSLSSRKYSETGVKVDIPVFGRDYVILWRGNTDDGVHGHIGWFITIKGDYIYMLGGNQSNTINSAKFPTYKIDGFYTPLKINN